MTAIETKLDEIEALERSLAKPKPWTETELVWMYGACADDLKLMADEIRLLLRHVECPSRCERQSAGGTRHAWDCLLRPDRKLGER